MSVGAKVANSHFRIAVIDKDNQGEEACEKEQKANVLVLIFRTFMMAVLDLQAVLAIPVVISFPVIHQCFDVFLLPYFIHFHDTHLLPSYFIGI